MLKNSKFQDEIMHEISILCGIWKQTTKENSDVGFWSKQANEQYQKVESLISRAVPLEALESTCLYINSTMQVGDWSPRKKPEYWIEQVEEEHKHKIDYE
jgi:hypothetical protein